MNKKRIFLLVYFFALIAIITAIVTGYTFSINLLDYLILIFAILFPLIKIIQILKFLWLKIILGLVLVVVILILGMFSLLFGEAGTRTKVIEKWTDGSYKAKLEHREHNESSRYEYTLHHQLLFGLVEKTVGESYPGSGYNDSCALIFSDGERSSKNIFKVDRCKHTVTKLAD